jgi:hypothetical protein
VPVCRPDYVLHCLQATQLREASGSHYKTIKLYCLFILHLYSRDDSSYTISLVYGFGVYNIVPFISDLYDSFFF